MHALDAGSAFPQIEIAALGGERLTLGRARGGCDWQLVVVYRGLHCPLCKKYLARLDELLGDFNDLGVDVVALSCDPEPKAAAMVAELSLRVSMGHDLGIEDMHRLGLYVSDPRSPAETDRPFPEPGLFVINGEGAVQIVDISNAPFARPDLDALLSGLRFVRQNDYPVRGTHRVG